MEMGTPTMDPEIREGLRRSWKALIAVGVLAILIGCIAILVPAVASAARGQQGAGLVGLSGVAGLLVGILVLAKFPSSADWAIGLLVGIDLIFAGWTLTSVALVGRDLARGSS